MSKRKILTLGLIFVFYLALVWFVAALLTTGTTLLAVGLVLSACGATILAVYLLVSRLTGSRPDSTNPLPDPNSATARPVDGPPMGMNFGLEELIADANRCLARSPKAGSRQIKTTVAKSPLYIVAGLENTGKTSLIRSLEMGVEKLSSQADLDSGAKTQVANLWYADGVVFAEAAGQLFANALDWRRFVTVLSGNKRSSAVRRLASADQENNLRGLILFCETNALLGAPGGELGNWSALQERLRAVGEIFRCNFPVYVVFSKSDRIPFFQDYFGRLRGEEDKQVLGCTLSRTPGEGVSPTSYGDMQKAEINDAFNALYYSLSDKRLTFLARENDPVRKPGIYEFPRELRRMRGNLVEFLLKLFQPHPLQPGPVLRGFYLTGRRQVPAGGAQAASTGWDRPTTYLSDEATRLLKAEDLKGQSIGAEQESRPSKETFVPKWAFISQLFRTVVLADARAVPVSYTSRKQDLMKQLFVAAAVGICAFAVLCSGWSWFNNHSLLNEIGEASAIPARDAQKPELSADVLDRMDKLRFLLSDLQSYEQHVPLHLGFLLYSGSPPLLPAVEERYFARFREYLLNDVVSSTTASLSRLPAANTAQIPFQAVYDQLKAYLMITTGECAPERPFLPRQLTDEWISRRRNEAQQPVLQQKILNQFDFYSREISKRTDLAVTREKHAIQLARAYLDSFGREERVYRQIVEGLNQKNRQSGARLAEYAPRYESVLTVKPSEIPFAYTKAGWDQVLDAIQRSNQSSIGDSCVIGGTASKTDNPASGDFNAKLRDLYVRDYAERWREFLINLHIAPYRSLEDAAQKLNTLTDPDSPLLGALYMVHEQTRVVLPAAATLTDRLQSAAVTSGALDRLAARLHLSKAAQKLPNDPKTTESVDLNAVFSPVHQLFKDDASRGKLFVPSNQLYADALRNMSRAMNGLIQNPAAATTDVALNQAASAAFTDGIDKVKSIAYQFDRLSDRLSDQPGDLAVALQDLLSQPFHNADGKFSRDPGKLEAQKVNGSLSQFCRTASPLLSKFPFRKTAADSSLAEFSAVFAPQSGAFAQFTQSLFSLVARNNGAWFVQPSAPSTVQVSPDFIFFLNRMSAIADALYGGQMQPRVEYRLDRIQEPGIQNVRIIADGRSLAGNSLTLSWPAASGSGSVQVFVVAGNPELSLPCGTYDGAWAPFRFLSNARPRSPGDTELLYTCYSQGLGGRPGAVQLYGAPLALRFKVDPYPAAARVTLDPGFFEGLRCPGKIVEAR